MKHLIVIPTYNEKENIENIIRLIFKLYPVISILVVDDSSPDGTDKIVQSLQKEYKNLFLLSQKSKSGLANAYINGFKWGLAQNFDLFTSFDADFSHNPIYIEKAVNLINSGNDFTCGSRYMQNGQTTENNWFRNFISVGGNKYIKFVLGKNMQDWTGGFNTYTKQTLELINLDSIKAHGYIFQAEMKYKAIKKGLKCAEFPIVFEERKKGKSKMNFKIILEAFFSVLKIKFLY